MRFDPQIFLTILALLLSNIDVNAQQLTLLQLNPTSVDTPTISQSEREELIRLRQEKEIRDRVQSEVDKTFRYTTTLLNILLLVLILLPIGTATLILLLRKSLINQVVSEIKSQLQLTQNAIQEQLQQKIALEFKTESETIHQQIETLHYNSLSQLQQVNLESQHTLKELILNKEIIEQAIQSLKSASESHIPNMNSLPLNSSQENEASVLASEHLTYSASDYIKQADSLFNQGLYEDANKFYNDALKIERDSSEIRYQNARCYALRYSVNLAIGNLQWAIDINPMYKEMAKTDSAFNSIRNDEKFKQLVNL